MADRLPCSVPHCRRTFRNDEGHEETICGKHWRLADQRLRRRRSKLERRYKKRFGDTGYWEYPAGSPKRIEGAKLARLLHLLWEKCKQQAIERGMGI